MSNNTHILKVEDVRYGNLLKAFLTQEIIKVDWLVIKHLSDGNVQSVYNPKKSVYEPIILTERWLERFGMITLDNEIDFIAWGYDNDETFGLDSDGFYDRDTLYFTYDVGFTEIRKQIRYVHELQNLYFAVTGRELPEPKE